MHWRATHSKPAHSRRSRPTAPAATCGTGHRVDAPLFTMAVPAQLAVAYRARIFTMPLLAPRRRSMRRGCLIHVENNSTGRRRQVRVAIVDAGNAVLLDRKLSILPTPGVLELDVPQMLTVLPSRVATVGWQRMVVGAELGAAIGGAAATHPAPSRSGQRLKASRRRLRVHRDRKSVV